MLLSSWGSVFDIDLRFYLTFTPDLQFLIRCLGLIWPTVFFHLKLQKINFFPEWLQFEDYCLLKF